MTPQPLGTLPPRCAAADPPRAQRGAPAPRRGRARAAGVRPAGSTVRALPALLWAAAALWAAPAAAEGAHAHHEHVAPHGGTLIALGDELAHLELVLDPETGELTAYVLDGEAQRGVAVEQPALGIDVQPGSGGRFAVALAPVANVLTGETPGNTSQFAGRSDRLKGLRRFRGEIRRLEVKGQRFERVSFRFPEGNEAHEHAEEDR